MLSSGRDLAGQLGEPPPCELLDRRDIHHPVVQPLLEPRHVAPDEPAVLVDRVPREHGAFLRGHVRIDERDRLRLGVGVGDRRGLDAIDEARGAVVLLVPVVHRREHLVALVDHQLGAGRDLGQVAVGEDRRDLDDALAVGIEPGHLHVEPDQDVGASHAATLLTRSGRA
jgi:hypothetical protein